MMKNRLVPIGVLAGILVVGLLGGCAGSGGAREQVIAAGLAQLGAPYRYGGEDPATGVDCSGLTYYAHHAAGIAIPRVSSAQRTHARARSGRRARPGDLVFFRTAPGVHHVGLMVDEERFVHASTSRREVRLARLDAPYWRARYLGAGTYLD
ncbi:C40 family peptidase [Marichromatium bheemlicum]|uniref:C40 family peptidase n=1 Tax=Marichromatium bheemlicum TaxID=365339 RepID=A0ABX1I311_9GAMM|nr:C40 family peptidase [Marichromatium bheemlicum]NKN31622.1 C40 family peptidase [Marichromatium bheemlicum]